MLRHIATFCALEGMGHDMWMPLIVTEGALSYCTNGHSFNTVNSR